MHANAGQLRLDPARTGIKGESGGGGFAAAAALYARDRQGPKFAFQHLIYPMIDDRTAVRKDLHPYVGEFVSRSRQAVGFSSIGWKGGRKIPWRRLATAVLKDLLDQCAYARFSARDERSDQITTLAMR